jgi:predicted RNA-binding protein YlxR (DUF448 family)
VLVRITKSDDGIVVGGASDGRGAWLCRGTAAGEIAAAGCVGAALSRRAFARAWRREVDRDDERAISDLAGRAAGGDEHPDAH